MKPSFALLLLISIFLAACSAQAAVQPVEPTSSLAAVVQALPSETPTQRPPTATPTPIPLPTNTPKPLPTVPTADFAPEAIHGIWFRSDPDAGNLYITLDENNVYNAAHGAPSSSVHSGKYSLDGRLLTFIDPGWTGCEGMDGEYILKLSGEGKWLLFEAYADRCGDRVNSLRSGRWTLYTPEPEATGTPTP